MSKIFFKKLEEIRIIKRLIATFKNDHYFHKNLKQDKIRVV